MIKKFFKSHLNFNAFLLCIAVVLAVVSSVLIRTSHLKKDSHLGELSEISSDFAISAITSFIDENIEDYTLEELDKIIMKQIITQDTAHQLANQARSLGWPEDCETIQSAKISWHNASVKISYYSPIYLERYEKSEQVIWDKKKEEYPVATEIWLYMKSLGWSDYVCAGILGNMMAEAGGHSLKIQPEIYNSTKNYYGICQWSKFYYPSVYEKSLQEQLKFLSGNIKYEIDTYGRIYKQGFKFNNFLNLTNVREVALAFAKSYERCNSNYYSVRQDNAEKAYAYFVGSGL